MDYRMADSGGQMNRRERILTGLSVVICCGCSDLQTLRDVIMPTLPEPGASEPVAQPATGDVWASARFRTAPEAVRAWPVVGGVAVAQSGGFLTFTLEHPELWPNVDGCCGVIWCFMEVATGQWEGGPCDGLRPPNPAGVCPRKEASCACVPEGDTRLHVPKAGDRVRFVVTGHCRNGRLMKPQQRTSETEIVWK